MLEGIYSRIFPARIFQRGKLKKKALFPQMVVDKFKMT